jgi:hypothetical protein
MCILKLWKRREAQAGIGQERKETASLQLLVEVDIYT